VAVTAVAALILVPVASIATYMQFGSPERPDMPLVTRMAADPKNQSIEELIARAEARVVKKPDDARGWAVLAPVYMRLRRPSDAANAYRNIIRISGSESQYESALGEALTIAANGIITVEAKEHFKIALKSDPEDIKAQFFLAASLGQEGKHAASIAAWEKLIAKSPKDAPWVKPAEQEMARMHKLAGTVPKPGKTPPKVNDATPKVGSPSSEDIANAASMTAEDRKLMIENMVTGLAEKLEEDPTNLAGWLRIIRSYAVLGRNEEASSALATANKTFVDNPDASQKLKELATAMKIEVKSP
jgi:cytochrome c-type biogenesis protein CcmH